jgi:predicted alpha/beta hydrolase family esterase
VPAETPRVLLLPGYGDSGPAHWQSLWEAAEPSRFQRLQQSDWLQPQLQDWIANLERAVAESGPQTLVAAHSLGCLLLAHWAATSRQPLRGALLVAVPDPAGPHFPTGAASFANVPLQRLSFPSLVVISDDDPYGSPAHVHRCASAWGSRMLRIGARGHINADSGLGDWPQGRGLLRQL